MTRSLCLFLPALLLAGAVSAADRLWFDGRQLPLKAEARACYLGFIELYDVDYFHAPTNDSSCVRLSYLRGFDAEALGEATRAVFEDRHGGDLTGRYRVELEQVVAAYRSVKPGDRYLYCLASDGTGSLLRDEAVVRLPDSGFARRFMQIWVQGIDEEGDPRWGFRSC